MQTWPHHYFFFAADGIFLLASSDFSLISMTEIFSDTFSVAEKMLFLNEVVVSFRSIVDALSETLSSAFERVHPLTSSYPFWEIKP